MALGILTRTLNIIGIFLLFILGWNHVFLSFGKWCDSEKEDVVCVTQWLVYSRKNESFLGDHNKAVGNSMWRSLFSFNPRLFFDQWTPLVACFLSVMRCNAYNVAFRFENWAQVAHWNLLLGFFCSMGYSGRFGILVGFWCIGISFLSMITGLIDPVVPPSIPIPGLGSKRKENKKIDEKKQKPIEEVGDNDVKIELEKQSDMNFPSKNALVSEDDGEDENKKNTGRKFYASSKEDIRNAIAGESQQNLLEPTQERNVKLSPKINGKSASHALRDAARDGDLELVEWILEDPRVDIHSRNMIGWTPLHFAASGGHTDIIKLLIKKKAYVDAKDNEGWTAFHESSGEGNTEILELLLNLNANLHAVSNDSRTALHNACQNEEGEACSFLIRHGIDPFWEDEDHETAEKLIQSDEFKEEYNFIWKEYLKEISNTLENYISDEFIVKKVTNYLFET